MAETPDTSRRDLIAPNSTSLGDVLRWLRRAGIRSEYRLRYPGECADRCFRVAQCARGDSGQ